MPPKIKFLPACSLTLLLSFIWLNLMGQDIKLEKGLYPSFYSFINQSPLPGFDVTMEEEEADNDWVWESKINIIPTGRIKKKELKLIKKTMWGFHDGTALYINSNNYYIESSSPTYNTTNYMAAHSAAPSNVHSRYKARYSKILYLGLRYSYFKGIRSITEDSGRVIEVLVGNINLNHYYILDMSDGEVYPMNQDIIEDLLQEDYDLYLRFKKDKEKKKNDTQLFYIQEFNNRRSY